MQFNLNLYSYCSEIDEIYKLVKETKNIETLKKLYEKVKNIQNEFYEEGKINQTFNLIKKSIRNSELVFENNYIIDTKFKLTNKTINKDSNEQEIIDYIVNQTRQYLLKSKNININYDNYYNIDFTNWCEKASYKIKEICNELKIQNYIIEIYPGFRKEYLLYNGYGYHLLNIIKLEKEYYLIDVTYSQFFKTSNCMIERIGLMDYPTPKPGAFINNNTQKFIKEIISNGYTKLNKTTLKAYLDLFAVSFRNGLYYEKTKDNTYTTQYQINDYINFLTKKDSQIKREGEENLGYQKKPIKQYENKHTKNM